MVESTAAQSFPVARNKSRSSVENTMVIGGDEKYKQFNLDGSAARMLKGSGGWRKSSHLPMEITRFSTSVACLTISPSSVYADL